MIATGSKWGKFWFVRSIWLWRSRSIAPENKRKIVFEAVTHTQTHAYIHRQTDAGNDQTWGKVASGKKTVLLWYLSNILQCEAISLQWNYDFSFFSNSNLDLFQATKFSPYLRDSVYLYLILLEEILEAGEDPRDGRVFFERSKWKTFRG